jgi:hypothetical protein
MDMLNGEVAAKPGLNPPETDGSLIVGTDATG